MVCGCGVMLKNTETFWQFVFFSYLCMVNEKLTTIDN